MTERKFEPLNEVTMYQARCTNCGRIEDDYGDFAAWADSATPLEVVTENRGWLSTHRPNGKLTSAGHPETELYELLCPACQSCAVCGKTPCYPHDDGEHVVCEEHEDHDFAVAPVPDEVLAASRIRPHSCGEPGPGDAHCTEDVTHRYSCYDAGDDVSFNSRQHFRHDCKDPKCARRHFTNEGD